jgi:hypothetical protein
METRSRRLQIGCVLAILLIFIERNGSDDCTFTTPAGDFNLAPLGAVRVVSREAASFGWTYLFSACANVDASLAAGHCSGMLPAVQATNGTCYSLGSLKQRSIAPLVADGNGRVGVTVALEGGDSCGGGVTRTISIDVVCADVATASKVRVLEGMRTCAYNAVVESRAGCPLACARDPAMGAVCGGKQRGACMVTASGGAACVCLSGHAGPFCAVFVAEAPQSLTPAAIVATVACVVTAVAGTRCYKPSASGKAVQSFRLPRPLALVFVLAAAAAGAAHYACRDGGYSACLRRPSADAIVVLPAATMQVSSSELCPSQASALFLPANVDFAASFAGGFANMSIDNPKGISTDYDRRFAEIYSDPSNLLIKRTDGAGTVSTSADGEETVKLHNGLIVVAKGYYDSFSRVLITNGGVHEPAEERIFGYVLNLMRPGAVMVELGSYWAMYSVWFASRVPCARVFGIEADEGNLRVGIRNAELNDVNVSFTLGMVNATGFHLSDFVEVNKFESIDLLHVDIQGSELEMLSDIGNLLNERRIRYLFLATHTQKIHAAAIKFLTDHNYRVIASADFDNETFCFDGVIIVCPEELHELPAINIGSRRRTPLRTAPFPF